MHHRERTLRTTARPRRVGTELQSGATCPLWTSYVSRVLLFTFQRNHRKLTGNLSSTRFSSMLRVFVAQPWPNKTPSATEDQIVGSLMNVPDETPYQSAVCFICCRNCLHVKTITRILHVGACNNNLLHCCRNGFSHSVCSCSITQLFPRPKVFYCCNFTGNSVLPCFTRCHTSSRTSDRNGHKKFPQ